MSRTTDPLRDDLRAVAKALGVDFEAGEVEVSQDVRPPVPLFRHWAICKNRFSGTIDGISAAMFDLTTIDRTHDNTLRLDWTIVQFAASPLPRFVCIPRSWKTAVQRRTVTPIRFDSRAMDPLVQVNLDVFESEYVLGVDGNVPASAEEMIRNRFRAPLLAILAQHPGWQIQTVDGWLVFAVAGIAPAPERPRLWHEAAALRRALLAPISLPGGAIPAPPSMDIGRQRARRTGHDAGCLSGALLGFFAAFIAVSALEVSRLSQGRPAFPRSEPSLVKPLWFLTGNAGGALLGAIVGRWLGGHIADRCFQHLSAGAIPQPMPKAWIVAGAFLGWNFGMIIGLVLVSNIRPPRTLDWIMPILFFSPGAFGLVTGGFAGGFAGIAIARRRAARRTGR
jgi:hypothetical protein